VGHGNYRAFFLLLLYGVAALWHATGLLLAHAWHVLSAVSADRVLRYGYSGGIRGHRPTCLCLWFCKRPA
jgi:hypothetical protein